MNGTAATERCRVASVSPQTCDKSKMRFLEMKICKSKKSLRMHVFFSIFQDVKKSVILRGDFETKICPAPLLYIISTITTGLSELRLRDFFFGIPLCSQGGPSPSIPRPHSEIS